MVKLGFALCGSFCTFQTAIEQMEQLKAQYDIVPIMSETAYETSTRFGEAQEIQKRIEDICGKKIIHTIVGAEPIGPKRLVDILLVAPCTGNTVGKISGGITDTAVTMAVKSTLRVGAPVVLSIASNDALGASAFNIGKLLNTKNIYLVPLKQDDPIKKPFSLVADFNRVREAVELAQQHIQLQPIYQ